MVYIDDSELVFHASRNAKPGMACPSHANETSMVLARAAALLLWMLFTRFIEWTIEAETE